MEQLWFWLAAFMIVGYVVLDGYDLGAGALHLFAAQSDDERQQVLQSIGPLWDGNEVWLVAGGGTLFFAFPLLYASSFSGFYLPLMMVLWLLIFRGLSIEFRNHVASPVWQPFWDLVFAVVSILLSFVLGAALGNVIRGVPLDAAGHFFLPLWTDLGVHLPVGILDWYTMLVGALSLLTLTQHGALWLAMRTDETVAARARRIQSYAWAGVVILTAAVTIATWEVQPLVAANLAARPWGYVFPALALGGLTGVAVFRKKGGGHVAFFSSALYIAGMLASAAFGIFPYVLPSNGDPANGLTVYNTVAGATGLTVGLRWWLPGMALAIGYTVFVHVKFSGKVTVSSHPRH
jgi:cytochrome d ubiquinol oxidase subunit II